MRLVKLEELGDKYRRQALDCILKTVEVSNSPDYPASVIEYQLHNHYTMEWINKQMLSRYFIVALIDDAVVGTGSLDRDEIKAVFVDPSHQRKGIGMAIMKDIEEHAIDVGLKEVILKSSITARDFYTKLGYRLVEKISQEFQGDTVVTYLMSKRFAREKELVVGQVLHDCDHA